MLNTLNYGLFSDNAYNISLDKRCLIQLGAQKVHVYTSWKEAHAGLGSSGIDFALVDDALQDVTGKECINRLRKNGYRSIPIVIVSSDRRKEAVLDSIAVGCGGYVLRPYSIDTLGKHLSAANQSAAPDEIEQEQLAQAKKLVSQGNFDDALEELEELVDEENPATKYYEKGMSYLAKEKFGKAIISFNKVIAMNNMYAEAYQAMAEAYKGKGNPEKQQEFLTMAADIYAVQDRLDEAKQVFAEILRSDPDALNPFNRLGVKLRKDGDYDGAVRAYHQACDITPDDPNLYYNMSRAYVFAQDFENAQKYVEKCISLDPNMSHAVSLREQILKKTVSLKKAKATQDMSGRVLMDGD
ncbi:MAG: tetratricopeptide repeat protein [Pseudodesulfovibrio sp.]